MGARGPRKKLPYIEALQGNPSKRAIEAMGVDGLGEPFIPEHLMDDARGCIEVIKRSMPMRVYSALDTFLLAAFGTAWALHKRAAHEINSPSFQCVVTYKTGAQATSQWLAILNRQALLIGVARRSAGIRSEGEGGPSPPAGKAEVEI